jgi:hypothetical protein
VIDSFPEEKDTDRKLAGGYTKFKAKRFGWAWLVLLLIGSQLAKNSPNVSFVISSFDVLAFPLYFLLRWKIINRMIVRRTYESKKWLPPLISIIVSTLYMYAVLIIAVMFR